YGIEIRAGKAISKAIPARGTGICYAGALCFAVRLVLLRAKVTRQDSNCRFDFPDFEPRIATPWNPNFETRRRYSFGSFTIQNALDVRPKSYLRFRSARRCGPLTQYL